MGRRQATPEERERGGALGRELQRRRNEREMTQTQLAGAAGVDLDALRVLEQGRYAHPSFFTVVALAQALDCTVEQIVEGLGDA